MSFSSPMVLTMVLCATPGFAQAACSGFEIRTLSARAGMVSGGDVLIQITVPPSAGNDVAIMVNGRDANAETRSPSSTTTRIVRLRDLRLGRNTIEVGLKGQKPAAHLAVVNHPITGPVISGPHQTPFNCETQALGFGPPLDSDCAIVTRVEYFHLIAQNYPGLLDGLIPTAAFADTLILITHLSDCELLDHAFETSRLIWTDDQKSAVAGEALCAGVPHLLEPEVDRRHANGRNDAEVQAEGRRQEGLCGTADRCAVQRDQGRLLVRRVRTSRERGLPRVRPTCGCHTEGGIDAEGNPYRRRRRT